MDVIPFTSFKGWLPAAEADALLASLEARSDWTQGRIRMFGREGPEPRLTIFEGDLGVRYTYAHRPLVGRGWSPELEALRDRFEREFGIRSNTVLANLYRDGRDAMGWHADDEPELGPAAPDDVLIASISLGATRRFAMRHRRRAGEPGHRHVFALADGDLFVMGGTTQRRWQHCVPRTALPVGPRLNLTFRIRRTALSRTDR